MSDTPIDAAWAATEAPGAGDAETARFWEVFAGAELHRVDEDAYHDVIGALQGLFYQGNVTGVQIAHGGHQTNALAFLAGTTNRSAHLRDGMQGVHGFRTRVRLLGIRRS